MSTTNVGKVFRIAHESLKFYSFLIPSLITHNSEFIIHNSLLHPYQLVGIVTTLLQAGNNTISKLRCELRRTAEYPQVFWAAAADHRIGVVGSQLENVVIAVEGSKEAYLQLPWSSILPRSSLAYALLVRTVKCLEITTIDYCYFTIVTQGVLGGGTYKVTFKNVVVAGNLVPSAKVAVKVKCGDCTIVNLLA